MLAHMTYTLFTRVRTGWGLLPSACGASENQPGGIQRSQWLVFSDKNGCGVMSCA
jgi:hypothetical protein